ncbi:uncharacterized protein LOC128999597 isoform X1 [Macrosteles quadrilineatus]|uniref:uncharacterized protein LOC128999597 isoform X1 n=1 Tax=Macrosteles quadrilineatus TaxID=74068 RepID=UPI0023E31CF8|nr:uncharacterized protein LOC128999597 isoform X1 [Macrosteles quadrilineatus]
MSGPRLPSDPPLPEKEPLKFETSHLTGAPEEVVQLVNNIKEVGEQFLYHWKTFPIILPAPVNATGPAHTHNNTNNADIPYITGGDTCCTLARRQHRPTNLRDLFVAPSFDELDAVAVDSSGEPRRLTGKQLESLRERGLHKDKYGKPKRLTGNQLETIRRTGEFEVPSLNFAGQTHKWRLSWMLQKGCERSRATLLDDLALALRFILVTARARLTSHFFSVAQAVKSLITGTLKLLDILVGVPSLQAHNLEAKLREERCRYLAAELVCRPEFEDSLESLCGFVRRQLRRAATEKFEVERESCHPPVPIPYLFLTPKGSELDLRLFSRDVMRHALPILVTILERETRGWFLHFRERLISELRAQKLPDDEIEREVNQAVMREYLQRVYSSILGNTELQALGEGVPQLLVQQAQSVVLMYRAVENVQCKLRKTKETLTQSLQYTHPILSRIGPWMRDKLRSAEEKFIEECKWSAHEEALMLCNNQHLQQAVYFLHRDLTFMKEREPVLLKELRKVKTPTRVFQWRTQIWFPRNWVVRRCFQGTSEVVPTVLSGTATSITTPRSDPSQPVFLVEKEMVRTTTTRWPMWRWINYCHRTWSFSWNAMFFFGVVVPWCSPVSLRALFCLAPFTPDLELSQVNGTLFPRKSSLTPTLSSRLLSLWRHISKSRTHFETKPDTGFIGKGLTRQLNRVWNYGVKGMMGTLALVVIFPAICLLVSLLSLLIAVTAFLWMPVTVLVLHLVMVLLWDLDCPVTTRPKYLVILQALVWDVGILGLLQPIAALTVALVICPIMSCTVATVCILRYWLRLAYDSLMFHLLIKKRARVPACDGFLIKRIAGPGLTSDYYYQIRPEQALAAFEAKLELDELTAYQHQMEQKILQPQKDFSQFVEACFGPFSATLARTGPYKTLEREAQDLLTCLHEKLDKRRRELSCGLAPTVRAKLKLTRLDLKIAIQQAALMMERLYPGGVCSRWGIGSEEEFWESKGLSAHDWPGLAGLIYTDIFSLDFLTPLDDQDTKFKLEPASHIDLSRYSELVRSAELGAGCLDLLGPVYAPRGNIQVHSPYLDVAAFNPRYKPGACSKQRETSATPNTKSHSGSARSRATGWECWHPWKRRCQPYSADKLVIPLPVPHPAHIAVAIHNRDTDDVIPLDSEICQEILRAVEDSSQECVEGVARYRGGGVDSSFDSVESRSCDSEEPPALQPPTPSAPPAPPTSFNWRQGEWANPTRRKRNSGTVRVDLASPEDVSLDTDSSRVVFSSYGTTV